MAKHKKDKKKELEAVERLLHIMDDLREQCPWDRKQTFESLRTLTIEETYELADAILEEDKVEISKELGDLLLHIVFYAKIGSETGDFDLSSIGNQIVINSFTVILIFTAILRSKTRRKLNAIGKLLN